MEFEIMFQDLSKECQGKVLRFYGLKAAEEGNFDVMPLVVIYKED